MGCCFTTTAGAAAEYDNKIQPKTRDTSPPGPGEETVKEVMSETPATSNKPPSLNVTTGDNKPSFNSDEEFRPKTVVGETASDVSSEIYSYSASFSAATTTTIGTGVDVDEDGEVSQKLNKPPAVKTVSRRQPTMRRRERDVRPPSPSPARKSVVRSSGKNPQMTSTPAQLRRNVVSSNVVGREPRRVRRSVRGEGGEARKVKNSGERLQVNVDVKLKKSNDVGLMPEPETGESLDNPLVSLECFIFL